MRRRGKGTYPVPREALDLAAENIHLVDTVMRERRTRAFVRGRYVDMDDLRSFAIQGLIRAAQSYTPEKGPFDSFATYVIWFWIRKAAFRANGQHRVHKPLRVFTTDWQEVEKVPDLAGGTPLVQEYRAIAVEDGPSDTEQQEAVDEILSLLTPEQAEVVSLLAEGLTNKEVAEQLDAKPQTVSMARKAAAAALLEAGYRRPPLRCVVCARRLDHPGRSDAQCCAECIHPWKAARMRDYRARTALAA